MQFLALALVGVGLLSGAPVTEAEKVSYSGYSVIRMEYDRKNSTQIDGVRGLKKHFKGLSVFSANDVMITSSETSSLFSHLSEYGVSAKVLHADYQELIDRVDAMQSEALRSISERLEGVDEITTLSTDDFFSAYRSNDEIHAYFTSMSSQYPSLLSYHNIGQTYEKRDQWAYILSSSKNGPNANKPTIVLEGGIHAREWIAHSTVCYMMAQLVTSYGTDPSATELVDSFNWVFIPIVNVDGYVYTWTTDRNWRKTRTPTSVSTCIGVDPNRNWDSHFCEDGASTDPCDESYCGPHAFSEPCVKNVADFILNNLTNVKGFIDFHSYSQLWMQPYGYTSSLPADSQYQTELGQQAVEAISNTTGYTYQEGSIYTIIYPASGSSADWGYDSAKIPFPYGVELRDTGEYGFILPPDQIIGTGQEILAAVETMANYIKSHPDVTLIKDDENNNSNMRR